MDSSIGIRQSEDVRRVTFVYPPAKDLSEKTHQMGHCSGVNSLRVIHDSQKAERLWTASRDSLIKAWEIVPSHGNRDSRVELVGEYEGHVDWVNDLAVVNEDLISSCSSDGTIRLWKSSLHEDSQEHASLACFSGHSDYITKLCCPGKKHSSRQASASNSMMFSCGLVGEVFVWDVERCSESQRPLSSLFGKDSGTIGPASVYSISCDYNGHLVCVGCSSGEIYAMDTRSGRVEFELLGHMDNVRGLIMSIDADVLVSGGSDHSMKVWDLHQRRCIHTCGVHTDSVWCLDTVRDDASEIYSSGKDGCVYKTDISTMTSRLLAREKDPITALCVSDNAAHMSLWVGSEGSSVRCYDEQESDSSSMSIVGSVASVRSRRIFESTGDCHPVPECNQPCMEIPGVPSILEVSMLTDKIHLIYKDSEGKVGMWDVTRAAETEDFGKADFKEKTKDLFDPTQSALTWFQLDCSLGVVAGHLQPSNCFTCETYTRQLGFSDAPPDEKVNLAVQMLKALFHTWKLSVSRQEYEDDTTFEFDKDDVDTVDTVFRFADESSPAVMVSGDQHAMPWKKSCSEMDGSEDVPEWVRRCVLEDEYPRSKALKMCFVLVPKRGTNLPPMGQSRLTAPRVLQVEKMLDYVMKRLKSKGIDCCKRPIYWDTRREVKDVETEESKQQVLLTCNGVLIPSDFTLAAVRQWMWKKPEDLRIEYSLADSNTRSVLPKIKMPM
jgi:WD repeat-containing protein 48